MNNNRSFNFGKKDANLKALIAADAEKEGETFPDAVRRLLKLGLKAKAAGFLPDKHVKI